jgi:hypothetical protein
MTKEKIIKECPKGQDLHSYTVGVLIGEKKQVIEKHLIECDPCLKEVVHFKRSLRAMSLSENIPVPTELKDKVILLTPEREKTQSTQKKAIEYIISLTEQGLKFIKTNLLPEDIEVNVSKNLIPAHAFREGMEEKDECLIIEQKKENINIKVDIIRGEGISVSMNVLVMKDELPLSKARITLYMDDLLLLSRNTADNGKAEFPNITLGDYTIKIPKEDLEMRFRILPLDKK